MASECGLAIDTHTLSNHGFACEGMQAPELDDSYMTVGWQAATLSADLKHTHMLCQHLTVDQIYADKVLLVLATSHTYVVQGSPFPLQWPQPRSLVIFGII